MFTSLFQHVFGRLRERMWPTWLNDTYDRGDHSTWLVDSGSHSGLWQSLHRWVGISPDIRNPGKGLDLFICEYVGCILPLYSHFRMLKPCKSIC